MKFLTGVSLIASVIASVQLDFDIYRGNSVDSLKKRNQDGAYFVKRDNAEMELENRRTFYMVDILLGSNENQQSVLIDTGSSDLWVMSHELTCLSVRRNEVADFGAFINEKEVINHMVKREEPTKSVDLKESGSKVEGEQGKIFGFFTTIFAPGGGNSPSIATGDVAASNTCTQYGSFDTGDSTSFNRNNTAPDFEILYADGTSASGIWGYDTLKFGDTTVENLSFAVANRTSSDVSVFGIGLPALEVTTQFGYEYSNLPIKMKEDGIIAKSAYSVYLGASTASGGTILFGGVDHAKYSGDLVTVPIISRTSRPPNRLEAMVDGISLNSSSNSVSVTENRYSANLDTGSTLSYFPQSLLNRLISSLGGSSGSTQGYTVVSCPSSSQTMEINFSGRIISVPLTELILRSGSSCLLGVLPQPPSTQYILFGDNVLRSMYVVFNLDDLEISIAQARYTTDTEVEDIIDTVPSAVSAAGYSQTSVPSNISENPSNARIGGSNNIGVPKTLLLSIGALIFGVFLF